VARPIDSCTRLAAHVYIYGM